MHRKQHDFALLYVEDEQEVRETLARMLKKRVRQLHLATNGEEGLQVFLSQRPEMVITDIRMPKMNGLQMIRQILAEAPDTPVIITSAHGDTEYLLEAIELGVSQYVLKPIDVARLFAAIDKCQASILVRQQETEIIQQALELKRLNAELEQLYNETRDLSLHDHLTGLPNRRMLENEMSQAFTRSKRYGSPLSLIVLDIDHFKRYNDTKGHVAGDQMLSMVGGILMREIRDVDFACRYGGEEFLLMLPETRIDDGAEVAERIRRAVETASPVTVSAGVAAFDQSRHQTAQELIIEADAALYRAKSRGRNRVEQGGTAWNEN